MMASRLRCFSSHSCLVALAPFSPSFFVMVAELANDNEAGLAITRARDVTENCRVDMHAGVGNSTNGPFLSPIILATEYNGLLLIRRLLLGLTATKNPASRKNKLL